MVKHIDSTYANEELEQAAANSTHMNADENTKLIDIIKEF